MTLRVPARPGQTWVARDESRQTRRITQLEAASDGGLMVQFSDGAKAWRTSFSNWSSWVETAHAELDAPVPAGV